MHTAGKSNRLLFQSTLPLRGATGWCRLPAQGQHISIHAPLTGSDPSLLQMWRCNRDFNPRSPYGERLVSRSRFWPFRNFNPRSPYGERPAVGAAAMASRLFQSTLPLRGATKQGASLHHIPEISIHAPLTGSDELPVACLVYSGDFNPRSPYGERLLALRTLQRHYIFQSTLPLRGATGGLQPSPRLRTISIHAPLTGSDKHGI